MSRVLATSTLALCVAAGPALAELTPQQVWEDLSAYYEKYGYQVAAGNTDDQGDRLVLSDVTFTYPIDETTSIVLNAPKIIMSETGGGDVRTEIDGDITSNYQFPQDAGDAPDGMDFTISMPGNEMISSGEQGDISHSITYPTLDMTLVVKDEAEGIELPIELSATNLKGTYTNKVDGGMTTTYDMTGDSARIAMDFAMPESADNPSYGKVAFNLDMQNISMTGTGLVPDGDFDIALNPSDMLRAGGKMAGTFGIGAMSGDFDFDITDMGRNQKASGKMTGESSSLDFSMDQEGLYYKTDAGKIAADVDTSELPFTISYAIESGGVELKLPVLQSDEAQPFRLAYNLTGMTMGDDIWNLFDGQQQLPRDPINLAVDMDGQMLVKHDYMDPAYQNALAGMNEMNMGMEPTPEQMAALEAIQNDPIPFAPVSLTVNKVAFNAAGASADVNGQLSFNDGDMSQPPVGELNGTFVGVNGLIDNLVAMGLVPQDQVMGAKMMMMMFAKPVDGQADTLETKLEFKEGGSIFANGQQVQ